PRSDARLKFLRGLIDQAHAMDPTRLVSAATEITYNKNTVHLDDPLSKYLDVIGANEYLGWYGGTPEGIPNHQWISSFDKPLVISEFGAGAKYGYHADAQTRWSEEYQADVYRNQFKMLDKIPFLRGTTPWILMDFRSPRRELHGIQNFWNRKGLIDVHGDKKEAFYLLRDWYKRKAAGM
ncbi:MAG TPA: glycoside hydrolase family 2 TIM barrel-domain containing protein, partial [Balneolales bacterium]|nr:glycoside hydrolase family 2 TIM barrel-domain containing protein [Balneolales bacterium]